MQQITRTYDVYIVTELSKEAFKKAHLNYIENNDYPFLSEELEIYAKEQLKLKGITSYNFKVQYSLSYCQGDGASLTGTFYKDDFTIKIKSNPHYCHEKSVSYEFFNKDGESIDEIEEIKNLFVSIFKDIKKHGYELIEFDNCEGCFKDSCEANEYLFLENGERFQ